ncbi:SDR family NAD(P)-dependent oxidoreductase [Mycobacterium avium]|uniref:SDR family NAD(P)-dependent oxidoreductase n=1 Tax=Mycobacterium avium TaxID=1764 RepID=UPI001CC57FAE|nr:SDR family NAD(P)-dependent oxidoreductase [Mycobacterium avium]
MGILNGRVAIVTGASSGVGRGCAVRFAEEGASLVLAARRIDKLNELAGEIESKGGTAVPVACDVANEDDIDNVVGTAAREFGKIEILASIAQGAMDDHAYLMDVTPEQALKAYVTGPLQSLLFMQKCFPYMKEQGYGRIINTASSSALKGTPGFASYQLAKGAVMALTRTASQEWAQFGIVTNTILPVIRTEAFDMSEQGKAAAKRIEEQIPVGRFGSPYEDCSPVVAFLASEGAGYLNGQAIAIDGGNLLIA